MRNYILFSTLLLAVIPLFAQWTSDTQANTLVASGATGDIQAAGTSNGKTYVAFWHNVPASKL